MLAEVLLGSIFFAIFRAAPYFFRCLSLLRNVDDWLSQRKFLLKIRAIILFATLAQLVEHHFRKVGVRSSILRGGSKLKK